MRFEITVEEGEKFKVARINGACKRHRFDREFLVPQSVKSLRRWRSKGPRVRATYNLTDGIYEYRESKKKECFVVLKGCEVKFQKAEVEAVTKLCIDNEMSVTEIVRCWSESDERVPKSLLRVARKVSKEFHREACKRRKVEAEAMGAADAFDCFDPFITLVFYKRLRRRSTGTEGKIAAELFRAQKASKRAKGCCGELQGLSYAEKGKAMTNLCKILDSFRGLRWGWKVDPKMRYNAWVLYVDLPQGQVSFHSPVRGLGPDYGGEYDGMRASQERIIGYCDTILDKDPTSREFSAIKKNSN